MKTITVHRLSLQFDYVPEAATPERAVEHVIDQINSFLKSKGQEVGNAQLNAARDEVEIEVEPDYEEEETAEHLFCIQSNDGRYIKARSGNNLTAFKEFAQTWATSEAAKEKLSGYMDALKGKGILALAVMPWREGE